MPQSTPPIYTSQLPQLGISGGGPGVYPIPCTHHAAAAVPAAAPAPAASTSHQCIPQSVRRVAAFPPSHSMYGPIHAITLQYSAPYGQYSLILVLACLGEICAARGTSIPFRRRAPPATLFFPLFFGLLSLSRMYLYARESRIAHAEMIFQGGATVQRSSPRPPSRVLHAGGYSCSGLRSVRVPCTCTPSPRAYSGHATPVYCSATYALGPPGEDSFSAPFSSPTALHPATSRHAGRPLARGEATPGRCRTLQLSQPRESIPHHGRKKSRPASRYQ